MSATPSASTTSRQTGYLFLPRSWRRSSVLTWLRRTHAWLGVWGAALGLLFGLTGFLLNHRNMMKIPSGQIEETTVQLPVPAGGLNQPRDLAHWLHGQLPQATHPRVRTEPAREVRWGDRVVQQPERWQVTAATPQLTLQAEYWAGNSFVSVKRSSYDALSVLKQLHKSNGMGAAWVLLADTLAGGLMVLSITGVLLWSRLHGTRLAAAAIGLGSCTLAIVLVAQAL